MTRRTALWLIAALLGILASAAVAWTASRLAGQRIGLSSAPSSVVRGLVPGSAAGGGAAPGGGAGGSPTPSHSQPTGTSSTPLTLPPALPPPVDDSSGGVGSGPDD